MTSRASVNNIVTNGYGASVVAIAGGGGTIIPASVSISAPDTTVGSILTAVVIGAVPTSYQWYLNGSAISGATASTWTTAATGVYTVRVNGTILSPGVNITAAVQQTFRSIGALGANVAWVNSTSGNRLFTNAFYNGARMQKTGQPGVNCARDPVTGWPTESFYVILSAAPSNGTKSFDGAVPPGTYNWSYSYDNTISTTVLTMPTSGSNSPGNVGVTGFSTGTPTTAGNITTVPFSFTFASLGTLNLSFSGPVTYVDCPLDGLATCVGQPMFRNEALASYAQYGTLRTLDMLWDSGVTPNVAGRIDINWADRPPNYTGPQLAQDIISWERAIAFILAVKNYPGSKLNRWMINLPAYCDPSSYAAPLATLFNSLNFPAGLAHFEYGNEPFNFSAGAASVRYHGWENAALNTVSGISNWEISTNTSAPTSLYQSLGSVISQLDLDSTGNVTVTLTVPCGNLVDLNSQQYVTVGAPLIVTSNKAAFQAQGLAADLSRTCTVTSVGTNTFVYSTGQASTTPQTLVGAGTSNANATSMYFKTTHALLADNLSFSIGSLRVKWYMTQLYNFQQQWQTVRDKATYADKWYINITPIGGAVPPAGSKTRPFDYTYGNYLGGGNMSNWIDCVATNTYNLPVGTVNSVDDLYNAAQTNSLYHVLNDPTYGQTIDNQCRGFVYQNLVYGLQPITYEGGMALQSTSAASFAVAAATDSRTETYLTKHQQVVLNNGVFVYTNYHSSPRIVQNGSNGNSAWQSMQFFNDSLNSGDTNYSAKKAALEKFNDNVFYTNIHGNDLTTLNASQYQNATVLTGNDNFNVFNNATTGCYYWGTGSTSFTRNMDWVYCNNTTTSRTITVWGTDSQNTAVQVWVFPPDLSGAVQIGTVHLANNGNAGGTSNAAQASIDTITWTPTQKGPYVFRLIIPTGTGTQPGFLKVVFS